MDYKYSIWLSTAAPFLARLDEYFSDLDAVGLAHDRTYSEADIQAIADLLQHVSRSWSRSPRLYIVLRAIGHLELLDNLIAQGFTDLWFPCTTNTLPQAIDVVIRADFVEAQHIILTKAIDLEKGDNGKHKSFAEGEAVPFESKAILGEGGFGHVDKVLSRLSHREYARKLIHRGLTFEGKRDRMRLFERELDVLKKVKHPHIVKLVGSYTDPNFIGLIMSPIASYDLAAFFEHVPGSNANNLLLRSFFGCLATALAYLHSSQIRHKDIKPANILVNGENVLLTDFGLSLDWQDLEGGTTTGETARSPRYCAPEVADYEPRNESSDIWSLGCVFLEMCTVIGGRTIAAMKAFFEEVGTGSLFYRSNPAAIDEWYVWINQPLQDSLGWWYPADILTHWVREMLIHDRKLRPNAMVMASKIRSYGVFSKDQRFCGNCCTADVVPAPMAGSSINHSLFGTSPTPSVAGIGSENVAHD
ncbi:MAG: hypothetical protein M1812_004885 [Candelaria pacifica]|nr:MAG: hypothetical protein M1812_004885 [Candelaria pacifica]